jgi:hypothetical protein
MSVTVRQSHPSFCPPTKAASSCVEQLGALITPSARHHERPTRRCLLAICVCGCIPPRNNMSIPSVISCTNAAVTAAAHHAVAPPPPLLPPGVHCCTVPVMPPQLALLDRPSICICICKSRSQCTTAACFTNGVDAAV